MTSPIPGYYTVEDAVLVLHRSHSMVCRYVRDGLLPAKRIGTQILIEQSLVHKFTPPLRGNPQFRKSRNR
jgi:excisionase family DNA binding protein